MVKGTSGTGSSSNYSKTDTERQKDELERYSINDNPDVNEYLREGNVDNTIRTEEEVKQGVKDLDNLIDNNTINSDKTLFRGADEYKNAQIGDTIRDKGFMSTSSDNETAEIFSENTVLEIELPSGSHAIDVTNSLKGRVGHSEDEYILDRNEGYKVVDRTTKTGEWGGGYTYLKLEPLK